MKVTLPPCYLSHNHPRRHKMQNSPSLSSASLCPLSTSVLHKTRCCMLSTVQYFHTLHIFKVYSFTLYSLILQIKQISINGHNHFNVPLKQSNILLQNVLMSCYLDVDTTLRQNSGCFPMVNAQQIHGSRICMHLVFMGVAKLISRRGRPICTLISNYENGFPTVPSIEYPYAFLGEHPNHTCYDLYNNVILCFCILPVFPLFSWLLLLFSLLAFMHSS